MSLGAQLRRFKKERIQEDAGRIVRETVEEFTGELVRVWSPLGDPGLWKAPPPADYRPGNFRSSWFLSIGSASGEMTEAVDRTEINHIERLAEVKAGDRVFASNSAPHAGALEAGHSKQANLGLMVNAIEFQPMAYNVARRVAG